MQLFYLDFGCVSEEGEANLVSTFKFRHIRPPASLSKINSAETSEPICITQNFVELS